GAPAPPGPPRPPPPTPKMFPLDDPVPVLLVRVEDEPLEVPVTTWSPGWSPLNTTVVVPSLLPTCTGTRTGAPLRRTTRKLCCPTTPPLLPAPPLGLPPAFAPVARGAPAFPPAPVAVPAE